MQPGEWHRLSAGICAAPPRFIRFVTATDRHTSAGAAIVPAPALSGAAPPAAAPGAPRFRSALRQPAQLIAQTLHLPAQDRDALAQRRVLPLHKTGSSQKTGKIAR